MRITFNFPDGWEDDYEYAEKQENTSLYLRQLVRKDRLNKKDNVEDKIIQLLNKIISNGKINVINQEHSPQKKKALANIINM